MCRSFLRLLVSFFALAACSPYVMAQGGNSGDQGGRRVAGQITGQVRFAQGNQPAFNILVYCESFGGGLVGQEQTDRNGRFKFSGLKPDQYVVTVRTTGFKIEQQAVDLQTVPVGYAQFRLIPDGSQSSPSNNSIIVNTKVPEAARKEFESGRSALLDKSQPEKAIPHLEKAISISPTFLEAELLLGTAYMELGQWEKSESALRRAVEIDRRSPAAFFALGELYRRQKKYAQAEKVLLDGLKLADDLWEGHLTLGRVYLEMGEIAKSGQQVGKALQLKPDLAEGHLLAGNLFLKARKPGNALIEFEEYLRLEPRGKFAAQAKEIVLKIKQALTPMKEN